jgi:hypothetical protein
VGRNVSVEELRRAARASKPLLGDGARSSSLPPRLDSVEKASRAAPLSGSAAGLAAASVSANGSKPNDEGGGVEGGGVEGGGVEGDEFERLLETFNVAAPQDHELSQVAKALKQQVAGLDPTPPPPELDRERAYEGEGAQAKLGELPVFEPSPSSPGALDSPAQPVSARGRPVQTASNTDFASAPLGLGARESPSSFSLPPTKPKRGKAGVVIAILVVFLLAGATAYWFLRVRDVRGGRELGTVGSVALADKLCFATVELSDGGEGSEILLRKGQGPVDVPQMPVKARIEFVVTAEGFAPKRAVVRADAVWDRKPNERPRLDVPVELASAKPGALLPWPAVESGTGVGGEGESGIVHLVTSPRGADVWLLIGLGEQARFGPLPCDTDAEFMAAKGTERRTVRASKDALAIAGRTGKPLLLSFHK